MRRAERSVLALAIILSLHATHAPGVLARPAQQSLAETHASDPNSKLTQGETPLAEYVRNAPTPAKAPSKRLPYFINHLDAADVSIHGDAAFEIALAGRHHISRLPKESLEKLKEHIAHPPSPSHRAHLRELVTGYLTATGTEGLRFLEEHLISSEPFNGRYGGLVALQALYKLKEPPIPRDRLVQSIRLLLEKPDIIDLTIKALADCKDWSSQDRIMQLLEKPANNTMGARMATAGLVLSSIKDATDVDPPPAYLAGAKANLETIKRNYPEAYKRSQQLLFPPDAIKENPAQARAPKPPEPAGAAGEREPERIAPVATGLSMITVYTSAMHTITFVPDGKTILSGHGDGYVLSWNVATGRHTRNLHAHPTWCFSIAFHPDGKRFATGSGDETVKLWSLDSKEPTRTLQHSEDDVHAVRFNRSGDRIVSAGDDMTVRVVDPTSDQVIHELKGHTAQIPCLAFSPTQPLIATGSRDDSIRLWNAQTGAAGHVLSGHTNDVHSVAFSPDGKWLASASYDETVKLWDVETGTLIRTFKGHENWVFSVAFHPNGKLLASGDKDGRVLLWNTATGTQLAALKKQRHVSCVAFSPDGRQLASSSVNATICLWDVWDRKLIRIMRATQ